MEAFIVLAIGAILIVVLNKLPQKDKQEKHPQKSVEKMFDTFEEKSDKEDGSAEKKKKNSRREEARELIKKADALLDKRKFKDAEKLYLEVLKIDEREVASYKGLGQICFEKKDYTDAREVFEKLTKLVPNDSSNYCNLGMCCYRQKSFTKAIKNYEKALSIEKKPKYYKNLAITLFKIKKVDDALEALIKALPESKKDPEVIKLIEMMLPEAKDKKIAKKAAKGALRIYPENTVVKRELSRL